MIASSQTPTRNHDVASIIKNSQLLLGIYRFISLHIHLVNTHRNYRTA